MLEMLFTPKGKEVLVDKPLKLKIISGAARPLPVTGRGMSAQISFNTGAPQTLSFPSGTYTNLTISIPANATEIRVLLTSNSVFDAENLFYTSNNSYITEVIDWGYFDPRLLFSCLNSTQLIKVPTTAPHWTRWGSLFQGCVSFNQDLSGWKTSHVVDMSAVFLNCALFNYPVNNWDTKEVRNTTSMFYGCKAFNQSIASWSVSKITDMRTMFMGCTAYNQNLSNLTFPLVTVANRLDYASGATSWIAQNRPSFAIT